MAHISFKYFDTTKATQEVLKDFKPMLAIISNTQNKLDSISEDMSSISSKQISDMPKSFTFTQEDKYAELIDKKLFLADRYREALAYMDWVRPAWEALSDDDRWILSNCFFDNNVFSDFKINEIMNKFAVERTTAYKLKNNAVERMRFYLFGK